MDYSAIISDILTPLSSSGTQFVTIDFLLRELNSIPVGVQFDREFLMKILDDHDIGIIKRVEGDRVLLSLDNFIGKDSNKEIIDKEAEKMALASLD